MNHDNSDHQDDIGTPKAAQAKIKDLPVEEGADAKADQIKGGRYVLKPVIVSSATPPRP